MHPGADVDLAAVINDDEAVGRLRDALGHVFDPSVRATFRLPGLKPVTYVGLDGLCLAWRDWFRHWETYTDEIEDVIDGGERVVVLHRYRAQPHPGAPETTRRSATVWSIEDGRVLKVDFNMSPTAALAAVGAAN